MTLVAYGLNTIHRSEHNSMGKRDGKTSEKVNKPNCIVQYRYMRSEDRAYQYFSYYLVVRESVK